MTTRILRILLIAFVLFDAFLIGRSIGRSDARGVAQEPVIVAPVSVGLRV